MYLVNFKDEGSQIQYAMLNLTVVEKVDNTFHFRAANPDDICDTIHFTRTVKLRELNQDSALYPSYIYILYKIMLLIRYYMLITTASTLCDS